MRSPARARFPAALAGSAMPKSDLPGCGPLYPVCVGVYASYSHLDDSCSDTKCIGEGRGSSRPYRYQRRELRHGEGRVR